MNEFLEQSVTALYLCNAGIAAIAYTPQCVTLWRMLKTDRVNKSVSLATWCMWLWACSVTLTYAFLVHQNDLAFKAIAAVNVAFCFVTVVLTLLVHRRYDKQQESRLD